ncbi:MAG: putative rane protein [Pseudomonadota bacterium]
MTGAELALVIAGAACAGFVQGLAGFGFGLVSLSFWAWGLPPQQAAVLATVGGFAGQLLAALTLRRGTRWALLWPMLAGALAGLPLGLWLLQAANATWFRLFVGTLLAVWCPLMLLSGRLPRITRGGRVADAAAGAAGGLMGPLGGFTGAIPSLWCTLRGMDRHEQRALMQSFNLVVLATTSGLFLQRGLLTPAHGPALAVTAASLLVPALLGMWLYTRISALAFRNVVLGLLTASGVAMLAATLPALVAQRSG